MRLSLTLLGILNIIVAFAIQPMGKGFSSQTAIEWHNARQPLIEAGALIENPAAIEQNGEDHGWWLMHKLLPDYDQRIARAASHFSLLLIAQGVILLILAARDGKRVNLENKPATE